MSALPHYVQTALRDLTRAEKSYVLRGGISGEIRPSTMASLQRKALFYLKITSPNGRCGFLELTPLGVTVQAILKARQAKATGATQ